MSTVVVTIQGVTQPGWRNPRKEKAVVKRMSILATAMALVALAVGVVGSAVGSSPQQSRRDTVLRLAAVRTEAGFLDFGHSNASLGDEFPYFAALMKAGQRVGNASFFCTLTSAAHKLRTQCIGTAVLRGGEITFQGVFGSYSKSRDFAITGGTGKHLAATGYLHQRYGGKRSILTFHLIN
jgi:hypothetical protein